MSLVFFLNVVYCYRKGKVAWSEDAELEVRRLFDEYRDESKFFGSFTLRKLGNYACFWSSAFLAHLSMLL